MESIAKLQAAKALIERGWCQKAYALDVYGTKLDKRVPGEVERPNACRWCISGALGEVEVWSFNEAYSLLRLAAGNVCLLTWNDAPGRSQSDAARLFDRAIELARAESSP